MPPTSHAVLLDPDHRNVTLDRPAAASRLLGYQISYQNITNSLAAFAVLVILRFILTKVRAWWVRAPGLQKDQLSRRSLDHGKALLVSQQRLHHHFGQGRSWIMDEKSRGVSSSSGVDTLNPDSRPARHVPFSDGDNSETTQAMVRHWESTASSEEPTSYGSGIAAELAKARHLITRPPPPPPLTPPELSTATFTFEDRRRSYAASAHELDSSFFNQPNPDYTSSTSTAVSSHDVTSPSSPSLARRRSYTKTLPLGIPPPTAPFLADTTDFVFSPSSYPPTSPLLPPPPPGHHVIAPESGSPHEIEMQGEIISVVDDHGAGWKRHTRVYGGGVCLACAASGREGGFYGDNVRPEEKR